MTDVLKYRFCQISGFSKCDIGLFSHLVWFLMGPWRPKLTNLSAVFCKKYKFKVNMHPEVIKIKSPPGTPWLQGKVTEFIWMCGSILLCGIWGSIKVGANPGSRQGKITKTIRGRSHITSAAGGGRRGKPKADNFWQGGVWVWKIFNKGILCEIISGMSESWHVWTRLL